MFLRTIAYSWLPGKLMETGVLIYIGQRKALDKLCLLHTELLWKFITIDCSYVTHFIILHINQTGNETI